jgi:hypothetical protein
MFRKLKRRSAMHDLVHAKDLRLQNFIEMSVLILLSLLPR